MSRGIKSENAHMDKDKNYNVETCDHVDAIAREMHSVYATEKFVSSPEVHNVPKWEILDNREKRAWREVAKDSLKIIANHAAGDIKAYAKDKFKQSNGWMKAIWGALLGAIALAGYLAMNSCTGVDNLILQGEKGQFHYYVTDSGERVLVVNPAKVNPEKK